MSLIKDIEKALVSINQARFQDLVNHFLHLKGYKFIGAPGSVVGKEKTRPGTPDSFFEDDGQYIFVECTTQEKVGNSLTFFKKLQADIQHCFDEAATSIKKAEIIKIILACTERVAPEEYNALLKEVQTYNPQTALIIYNIQNLPLEIYDFPGLTERYLGVVLTKGDIYTLTDFLEKTTKGLQPSLTNPFLYRDNEIESALQFLQLADILVLSGQQGTGKSKLATIIEDKMQEKGYIPFVIQSSGVPLWEDILNLLQYNKNYIILFDDANKAVNNLEYLLSYMQKPRPGSIKLIITVRDYVRNDLSKLLNETKYHEINLQILKDNEISKIITAALPTLSQYPQIVERIVSISKGNARVALMATYSVQPGSDINYVNKPVTLYEKYFEKVATELNIFQDKNKLQALAIVAFFGALDRDNDKIKEVLHKEFDIDYDELWDAILFLHKHELVDVYKDQVCKVSDQVLASYAFFQCFINSASAVISYYQWVKIFLKSNKKRITNTLIDANNTFSYEHVREMVLPHLHKVAEEIKDDDQMLYSFYEVFWYYRETDTLLYIKKWIKSLENETESSQLSFKYTHNDHVYPSKTFALLIRFWDHPSPFLKVALSLGLELVCNQISRLPEFLKFLHEYFSVKRFDYSNNYQRQNILLDELFKEGYTPYQQKIVNGIFLNIADVFLGWEFTETGSKGMEMIIYNFRLFKTPQLMDLRKRVLENLFLLYEGYSLEVEAALRRYPFAGREFDISIYTDELPLVKPFIISHLSEKNYNHCKFVKRLAKTLTNAGCTIPNEWEIFMDSAPLKLARILKKDFESEEGITTQEGEKMKREALQSLVVNKSWEEIEELFEAIETLNVQQTEDARWWMTASVSEIFNIIVDSNKTNFINALNFFFQKPLNFNLNYGTLIFHILENKLLTGEEFYQAFNKYDFEGKVYWKLTFFHALPEDQINPYFLQELLGTFHSVNVSVSIHSFHQLMKYNNAFLEFKQRNEQLASTVHNIVTYLTVILLGKKDAFRIDFGFHFCRECAPNFAANIPLLKQVYFHLRKIGGHFDYDGKELEAIMKLDSGFFVEYLSKRVVDFDYLSFRFEDFKLDFIWNMPGYKEIMSGALKIIIKKAPLFSSFEHPANVLFNKINFTEELKSKIFSFIEDFITANHSNQQHILIIMNVITHRFPAELLHFLRHFLLLNNDIAFIKNMWLDKHGVYSGSRVPMIQDEITLYTNVVNMAKELPDMLNYADHINYWEKTIEHLKLEIIEEQKRDFKGMN